MYFVSRYYTFVAYINVCSSLHGLHIILLNRLTVIGTEYLYLVFSVDFRLTKQNITKISSLISSAFITFDHVMYNRVSFRCITAILNVVYHIQLMYYKVSCSAKIL